MATSTRSDIDHQRDVDEARYSLQTSLAARMRRERADDYHSERKIHTTRVKRDALKGLRTHAWLVLALAAVGVFLVGLLVLSGTAQAVACVAAAVVFLIACLRVLETESYRKRDAGLPPPPEGPFGA